VFYLGDPSRTLALLLASLLVGSGVGSFLSGRSDGKLAVFGGLLTAGVVLAGIVGLRPLFAALGDYGYIVRQGAAAAILFVNGLPMGVMFPLGLRVAEARLGNSAIAWMWAVNGSASVMGSALAIMIAMSAGYTWSLLFGAICYLSAALLIFLMLKARPVRAVS
jgi:hypothetical protein